MDRLYRPGDGENLDGGSLGLGARRLLRLSRTSLPSLRPSPGGARTESGELPGGPPPASLLPQDEVSGRHWVFSGCGDAWRGRRLGGQKRKETSAGRTEAGTLPRGTRRRSTPPLCAQKGACARERRSCAPKKNPSPFGKTLGSAFQSHRLRFKPIWGRKSPGGRPMARRSPGKGRGSPPGATGGLRVPPGLPRASQPHRFENLALPPVCCESLPSAPRSSLRITCCWNCVQR